MSSVKCSVPGENCNHPFIFPRPEGEAKRQSGLSYSTHQSALHRPYTHTPLHTHTHMQRHSLCDRQSFIAHPLHRGRHTCFLSHGHEPKSDHLTGVALRPGSNPSDSHGVSVSLQIASCYTTPSHRVSSSSGFLSPSEAPSRTHAIPARTHPVLL